MSPLRILALALLLSGFVAASPAISWDHVARAGETLEQLAGRYYDRSELSMVIRAANGFVHPDDGRLIEGERVEIPEVTYHRVRAGEDWGSIAARYLGSAKRGKYLAELNGKKTEGGLVAGRIVKVPYQLLYILAPDESLKSIARSFLGTEYSQTWVRAYNLKRKKKYGRGDAVLLPLMDVEFTEEIKVGIAAERGEQYSEDDQRAQVDAVAQIATMRKAFGTGRYIEMVATGQRLLHAGKLTVPQQIGVHKFLAFAYVALGEHNLALGSFIAALVLQPGMELSPITTSPKILEVFREARGKVASRQGDGADQQADSGAK
ncbi:MAG: LysM peptidoglycan-binding domain-containing protein [Deltaproteobacteria bacterium]|nr:LysM peptidoglycan-binding domain-containing protein [Deltaproteobacteria bacterium]